MQRSRETATVSVKIIEVLLESAEAAGVARDGLLGACGLSGADLKDPDGRIPLSLEQRLWETAVAQSGDHYFGLHAGLHPPLHRWDVLGYVVQCSATVREAFEQLIRYNRLVHDVAIFALDEDDEEARMSHRFRGALLGANRPAAEFTLASVVHQTRLLTGVELRPRRIAFQHARPAKGADKVYREVFGSPVSYGAETNLIVLERAHMELPLHTADPNLLPILARQGDAMLAELPELGGWTDRVRGAISAGLPEAAVSLEEVSRSLKASPRTVQRRLADEHTSHHQVLEEVRSGLARRYVAQPQVSLAEIAFLLGFSEPAAFRRAFKRWTGESPSAYRNALRT